jgi:hypothetical protein
LRIASGWIFAIWKARPHIGFEIGSCTAKEVKLTHATFSPYASFEAYYDSRFDTVSRFRTEAGAIVPFARWFEGDFYLGWQRDTQPKDKKIAALGATMNFKF